MKLSRSIILSALPGSPCSTRERQLTTPSIALQHSTDLYQQAYLASSNTSTTPELPQLSNPQQCCSHEALVFSCAHPPPSASPPAHASHPKDSTNSPGPSHPEDASTSPPEPGRAYNRTAKTRNRPPPTSTTAACTCASRPT